MTTKIFHQHVVPLTQPHKMGFWAVKGLAVILFMLLPGFYATNAGCLFADQVKVDDNRQKDLNLSVRTNRKRYRRGEPITISAYLENVSNNRYYVGKDFDGLLGSSGLHDFELRIFGIGGKEIPLGHFAGDWLWRPNTLVKEKLSQAYIELSPGIIHGVRETLNLRLKPGRYKLSVVYREFEALRWTHQDIESLMVPVWTRSLESNRITISIVK